MRNLLDIILRILGAIMLGMIALGLFSKASSQPKQDAWLQFTPEEKAKRELAEKKAWQRRAVGWAAYGVSGTLWGGREAYHADPRIFEARWGVDPYSFLGSNAWERNYKGNRYQNADGSMNAHKPEWANSFRDIHHFAGAGSRVLVIGGTFAFREPRASLQLFDVVIGMLVFSASSSITYNLLR